MTEAREMSKGEKLVRANFNPSASSDVDELKRIAAEFIDAVSKHSERDGRCVALAITHAETAAMFAVKAATA